MTESEPTIPAGARETLEREARQWLVLLTSGQATIADAEALKHWCDRSPDHAQAFAEANLLWDSVAMAAERPAHPRVLSRRAIFAGAGAAAAAAGFLMLRPPFDLWPSAAELSADYRTGTGERKRITLETGVSIDLNTRTSLNLRGESNDDRLELVSGEAAIATAQTLTAPLVVSAAGGQIRVSNGQFNVRCDNARAVVTCERGSVMIDYAGRAATLGEGRQITYADGTMETAAVADPFVVMAWRRGQLVFRQTPLSEVVREINRYRSGRIMLMNDALGSRPVEARVTLDRIDDLIVLIREAYGASVTTLPGGVVVLS